MIPGLDRWIMGEHLPDPEADAEPCPHCNERGPCDCLEEPDPPSGRDDEESEP